jgi:hypothetical protein
LSQLFPVELFFLIKALLFLIYELFVGSTVLIKELFVGSTVLIKALLFLIKALLFLIYDLFVGIKPLAETSGQRTVIH